MHIVDELNGGQDQLVDKRKGKNGPLPLVVGYIRASTQGQVKDGESLPRQEALIRAYCAQKNLPNIEIIADEGISGFKSARPGFKRLNRKRQMPRLARQSLPVI